MKGKIEKRLDIIQQLIPTRVLQDSEQRVRAELKQAKRTALAISHPEWNVGERQQYASNFGIPIDKEQTCQQGRPPDPRPAAKRRPNVPARNLSVAPAIVKPRPGLSRSPPPSSKRAKASGLPPVSPLPPPPPPPQRPPQSAKVGRLPPADGANESYEARRVSD